MHALKGLDGEWRLAAFVDGVMRRTLPLILAVDEDAEALERITGELQRYARDYEVICGPSTEAALAQLEAAPRAGRRGRDRARRAGHARSSRARSLLERVHDLHPHAKRALLIPWGGWADEETATRSATRWRSATSTTTRSSRSALRTSSSIA